MARVALACSLLFLTARVAAADPHVRVPGVAEEEGSFEDKQADVHAIYTEVLGLDRQIAACYDGDPTLIKKGHYWLRVHVLTDAGKGRVVGAAIISPPRLDINARRSLHIPELERCALDVVRAHEFDDLRTPDTTVFVKMLVKPSSFPSLAVQPEQP
jgi:hypothetical protein